jgi:lipoprotein-anchoring transpeptidase ErfK/SrfK
LTSNLPYKQATIPEEFRRHIVDYSHKETSGTIVVDSDNKFLYYVLPKGQAIRYGVTEWTGESKPIECSAIVRR